MFNILLCKEVMLNVATDMIHLIFVVTLLLMIYMLRNVHKQTRFVYRHTVRSGDWSMKSFVWAINTALKIYK